ncbi:MAG TPA: Lrp/AsnC family transcriptional regulator, partial [Nitrososphaeraceae archaeon]|nr:Lrp/AsnC family transcriptional regulator [Nitrososphaeraceae archaeon]
NKDDIFTNVGNTNSSNSYSLPPETVAKTTTKLLNSINIKIIAELVRDPTISSVSLANKLRIPLSTLQRRRARIENSILKRCYSFNFRAFGGRVGDLIINVEKGKSKEVAQFLLKRYRDNVTYCHTRINSEHNVSAQVVYKDTQELHELLESVKTMDNVVSVQWSETVEMIGDNHHGVISAFFNK